MTGTPKVFDVDAAVLAVRPLVRLRGVEYRVVDLPLEDALKLRREYYDLYATLQGKQAAARIREKERQAALAAGTDAPPALPDVDPDEWRRYKVLGIRLALVDVPEELAASLSEREFEAVAAAVAVARDLDIGVLEKNGDGATSPISPPLPTSSAPSGEPGPTEASAPAPS